MSEIGSPAPGQKEKAVQVEKTQTPKNKDKEKEGVAETAKVTAKAIVEARKDLTGREVIEELTEKPDAKSERGEIGKGKTIVETVHRAGWADGYDQNSISNLETTLIKKGAKGAEVDIMFTADGVPVIFHSEKVRKDEGGNLVEGRDPSKMTFEEFQKQCPDHMSLEGFGKWQEKNEALLKGKDIWFDLKGGNVNVDAYKLIQDVARLGEHAFISTKDPAEIMKLLIAKKLTGSKAQISLAIPDPITSKISADMADNLMNVAGLKDVAELGEDADRQVVAGLKPDWVNFYWPEPLMLANKGEKAGHGEFVMYDDAEKPDSAGEYEGLAKLGEVGKWASKKLRGLRDRRLKKFVEQAQSHGIKVMAGSTESATKMDEMINNWNVDGVMPNNPNVVPDVLAQQREIAKAEKDTGTVPEIAKLTKDEQFAHTKDMREVRQDAPSGLKDIRETALQQELSGAVKDKELSEAEMSQLNLQSETAAQSAAGEPSVAEKQEETDEMKAEKKRREQYDRLSSRVLSTSAAGQFLGFGV